MFYINITKVVIRDEPLAGWDENPRVERRFSNGQPQPGGERIAIFE